MSGNSTRALVGVTTGIAAFAPSALAHPGSHDTLSFTELAAHYASGWHLAVLLGTIALATLVVLVAANRGRQARVARNRRSGS